MKAQSSWISEAHGKLGGAVFRHTRHGMVISSKRSPTKREGQPQQEHYSGPASTLAPSYKQVYSKAMGQWRKQGVELVAAMSFKPANMTELQWWVYYSYSNSLVNGILATQMRLPFRKYYPTVAAPYFYWVQCINFPEVIDAVETSTEISGWPVGNTRTWICYEVSCRFPAPLPYTPVLYKSVQYSYSSMNGTFPTIWGGALDIIGSGGGQWIYARCTLVDTFTGFRYQYFNGWTQIHIEQIEC